MYTHISQTIKARRFKDRSDLSLVTPTFMGKASTTQPEGKAASVCPGEQYGHGTRIEHPTISLETMKEDSNLLSLTYYWTRGM
jgi:hypothetical protein